MEKKEETHTRLLNKHDELQQELEETVRDKEKLLSKLDEAFDKIKNHTRYLEVDCCCEKSDYFESLFLITKFSTNLFYRKIECIKTLVVA